MAPRRVLDHPSIPRYTVLADRLNLGEGRSTEQQQYSEYLKAAEEFHPNQRQLQGKALATARRSSSSIVQPKTAR